MGWQLQAMRRPRARASLTMGARGKNWFIARVIAYTYARTGSNTPGGHGNPYAPRTHDGRIASVAPTTTPQSGRYCTGIGGLRIVRIPARAAGDATSPPLIETRYSRISS